MARVTSSLRRSAWGSISHVLLLVGLVGGLVLCTTDVARPALPSSPNILFVLTDDQRFDELQYMPALQQRLIAKGASFTHAFASNPLCCPSRATILTGQYSGTNGVWNNMPATGGGWPTFFRNGNESHTIAVALHDAGYQTGLIGKYFNAYANHYAHVPEGWDRWFALTDFSYFGPSVSDQGVLRTYDPAVYTTDLLGKQAVDFIKKADGEKPLFLYWAPYAPHLPSTPAPRDAGALSGVLGSWRPPSYNEADVSDKPWFVQADRRWSKEKRLRWDQVREGMYESLIDVDRWFGNILNALDHTGRLHNTLIVFMSDNGFLWGEHRRTGKVVPYDESIRVPFIVRWDDAGWAVPATDDHLVSNVDVAGTLAAAAGTTVPGDQGENVLALLDGSPDWRTNVLLEHYADSDENGAIGMTYCGIRTDDYAYAQYFNGFEELYDLDDDPYELTNVAGHVSAAPTLTGMRARTLQACTPLPPGFHFVH